MPLVRLPLAVGTLPDVPLTLSTGIHFPPMPSTSSPLSTDSATLEPHGQPRMRRQQHLRRDALVWVVSALLSVPLWRLPLSHDDQALFTVGASVLDAGGQLYRDHWDVKQPGIYWLYAMAQQWSDSGPTTGIHLLLSLWIATAAVFVSRLGARLTEQRKERQVVQSSDRPGVASIGWWLAPLLAVATLVSRGTVLNVAQVEMFVGLPILVCLFSAVLMLDRLGHSRSRALAWMALAGFCIALVASLKLIIALIPGLIVCLALYRMLRIHGARTALLAGTVAGVSCAAGLFAVALPFLLDNGGELFLWTQFVFPLSAVTSTLPLPPLSQLALAAMNFASTTLLFVVPALIGLRPSWLLGKRTADLQPVRERLARDGLARVRPSSKRSDGHGLARAPSTGADTDHSMIVTGCLVWLAAGCAVIVAQRFSWHAYHFTMLLWPVALLASCGIDAAWRHLQANAKPVSPVSPVGPVSSTNTGSVSRNVARGRLRLPGNAGSPAERRTVIVAWIVIVLSVAGLGLNGARLLVRYSHPFKPNVDAEAMRPELTRLLGSAHCRSAIAFGSPALLLSAGLTPVIPITGQLTLLLNDVQKDSSLALLRQRAPQFVAIDPRHHSRLSRQWPGVEPWLRQHYRLIATDSLGTDWYAFSGASRDSGRDCPTVLDAIGDDPAARQAARENRQSILGKGH